ncbi:unnamed protein product, partial [Ectocarpus sp. 12 AP-2014]
FAVLYHSIVRFSNRLLTVPRNRPRFNPSNHHLNIDGRSRRQAWLPLSAPSHNHLNPHRLQLSTAYTAFRNDLLRTTPRHGLTNRCVRRHSVFTARLKW